MQLIYAQGACSLAVHIMLEELSVPYESIKVSLKNKDVLNSYNPRGYVPALVLNDGTVMTEAISILQFLSSTHSDAYSPKSIQEKAKCIEWLAFISTELHKGVAPFFYKEKVGEKYLEQVSEKLNKRLQDMDQRLQDHAFLVDETYTTADMYAFAILRIIESLGIDLSGFKGIQEYKRGLKENPVIKRVLDKEEREEEATEVREFNIRENFEDQRPQSTL